MRKISKLTRYGTPAMAAILLALGLPAFAHAQTPPDPTSQLLIAILVKKGVLSQTDANSIMREAQAEANAAQVSAAPPPPPPPVFSAVSVKSTRSADGTIHVTYVPPNVRDQLVNAVTAQMNATQAAQGFSPEVPEWVNRVHISGDFRFREENDLFPKGNDNAGAFPNFNAINTGSPYDTSQGNINFPPQLNVDQNRNRFRARARIAVDADLGEGFALGFRIATGENDSPVSENQTLGGAAGGTQGGSFAKDAIWLDRAFLAYTVPSGGPLNLKLEAGRFDNPFFSTNLIWADDLGFDGVAANATYNAGAGLTPFVTGGAFPVYNTDFSVASNQPAKYPSHNKWLFGFQAGTSWKINDDYSAKVGVADYLFANVAGKLSAPCYVYSAADQCSTDSYRPTFAQNGNTYMALRNLVPTAANGNGTTLQYQYFGLASGFDELALTGEFDIANFAPTEVWVNGEYVRNLAFDKKAINAKAVNNRQGAPAGTPAGTVEPYTGGNSGYYVYANVGDKVLVQRWDWNAMLGYKYLESDAVMDGLTDSDFGLGGTNLKGYIVGGNVALSKRVWVRLRYLSADSISGPPYKADVFQFDLNAKF